MTDGAALYTTRYRHVTKIKDLSPAWMFIFPNSDGAARSTEELEFVSVTLREVTASGVFSISWMLIFPSLSFFTLLFSTEEPGVLCSVAAESLYEQRLFLSVR